MEILEKIEVRRGSFSRSDGIIAAYIEQNYPQAMLSSAMTIARELSISPSTVVRFFPKLGYASFAEAQDVVRLDVARRLASPAERANLQVVSPNLVEAVEATFREEARNLERLRTTLNMETYAAVIDRLCHPDRGTLYLAGAKNSFSLATYLGTHLNMCLPGVQLLRMEGGLHADQLLWSTKKDMVLVISVRRYSRATMKVAEHFHQMGAPVVALVDSAEAPVAKLAAEVLQFPIDSASPFDSFTAGMSLCNLLVAGVASRRPRGVLDTLQRGDGMWKAFEIFT